MKIINKKILFVGAHIDDIVIGCGGVILKLIEDNCLHFLVLTDIPVNAINTDNYRDELIKSFKLIGSTDYSVGKFKSREFSYSRQEILDFIYSIREEVNPDVVFYHGSGDMNQDHRVVNEECFRAFRDLSSLVTYEYPHNTVGYDFNCAIELSKELVLGKLELLRVFKSQSSKNYIVKIYHQLVVNGISYGFDYAELFKIIKLKL